VLSGMEVVDKIESVKTGTAGPYSDVPLQAVTIKRAYVKE
jgi:cyclophilin family peptidyl-prolyl cis-trans isomerase